MTAPYNLTDTIVGKASFDRILIYILCLDVADGTLNKPFYIGAAKNIAQRFTNHKEASWHYKTFQRPVQVVVIGSVPDGLENKAMADLRKVLVGQGFRFFPNNLNKSLTEKYVHDSSSTVYDLTNWGKQYKLLNSKTVTKTNRNIEAASTITVGQLETFINSQEFLDTETLNTALKIARKFNSDEGCSKIVFTNIKNKDDVVSLQKTLNKLRFIWTPQYKLKPYSVNEYRLTRTVLRSITDCEIK